MKPDFTPFLAVVGQATICAVMVFLGITTGNAISWAVAAFVAIMAVYTISIENRL